MKCEVLGGKGGWLGLNTAQCIVQEGGMMGGWSGQLQREEHFKNWLSVGSVKRKMRPEHVIRLDHGYTLTNDQPHANKTLNNQNQHASLEMTTKDTYLWVWHLIYTLWQKWPL